MSIKRLLLSFILSFICVAGPLSALEAGPVVSLYDGDTISIQLGDIIERVRLLGIDSPELRDKKSGVAQCYAREAKEKLSSLISHRTVLLRKDPRSKNRDLYGRLLRYVFTAGKNPIDIDSYLVQQGYARVYRASPISQLGDLEKKELAAKKIQRGLWNRNKCP